MSESADISGYVWANAELTCAHDYLWPPIKKTLQHKLQSLPEAHLFELGCGNGAISNLITQLGWRVTGVDPSAQGIAQANQRYPNIDLKLGSAYEDLHGKYGQFPVVVSLEVVEHVYAPRDYAATLYALTQPGGMAIVSTPYHGYLKNLTMALSGKMDAHFTALWDHGHIKFWSIKTLRALLEEAGFHDIEFLRVGRIGPLAKSMIAMAHR
jgi:2-polyprenyl-6-hydroxyphenyl methylase/3-demethylubiquinone-9 3-methyltransferase